MGGSHPTSRVMVELMFKLLKTKLMNVLCDRIGKDWLIFKVLAEQDSND